MNKLCKCLRPHCGWAGMDDQLHRVNIAKDHEPSTIAPVCPNCGSLKIEYQKE